MQKSAAAFRTISEVGEVLDVPAHVLRFWESKFSQIKPVKRGGGRRYYRPEDVGLIRGIQHLLYERGMTIKGAQKVLGERGVKSIVAMGSELLANGEVADQPAPAIEPAPKPEAEPAPELVLSTEPELTQVEETVTTRQPNPELQDIYDKLQSMRSSIRQNLDRLG